MRTAICNRVIWTVCLVLITSKGRGARLDFKVRVKRSVRDLVVRGGGGYGSPRKDSSIRMSVCVCLCVPVFDSLHVV